MRKAAANWNTIVNNFNRQEIWFISQQLGGCVKRILF